MAAPVSDSKLLFELIRQQTQEIIKVKEAISGLFTKALSGEDITSDLKVEIGKIDSFSDEVEKNKIQLFTNAFVICTHLSKWDIIQELITSPICAKLQRANFIAAVWRATFEGKLDLVTLMQKNHPDFFESRDRRLVFFAKRGMIDKIDYHSFPKEED